MKPIEGYKYIAKAKNIYDGAAIIIGTRLTPEQIVSYGTKEEAAEDFGLSIEQIEECYAYIENEKMNKAIAYLVNLTIKDLTDEQLVELYAVSNNTTLDIQKELYKRGKLI